VNSQERDDRFGQSTFVTTIAWLFIVLAGFATCVFVLQNIMIDSMLSAPDTQAALAEPGGQGDLPSLAGFVIRHMRLGMLAFLALCASTLVAAIGLLIRKNWARIVFIGLMALGIVWNVGGVIVQYRVISVLFHANAPNPMRSPWETVTTIMAIFSSVMALGFAGLFGWVIKRLLSPNIGREFKRRMDLRA
jgi:hypothetical protein